MQTQTFKGEYDLLALHQQNPARYPFLLESVATSLLNRYSLLFAFPQTQIRLDQVDEASFCERLDAAWRNEEKAERQSEMPFRGGWFLYLGYELVGQLEPTLHLPATSQPLPIALAVRIPAAIIVDHHQHETIVVAEHSFEHAFATMQEDISTERGDETAGRLGAVSLSEDLPEQFTAGVERIREYIGTGDVFQVNLSRAWQGELQSDQTALDLYRSLRNTNPAPFACLAQFDDFAVISSSPERLVRVQNSTVDTRPIAGTRPRGDNAARDQALLEELIAHPKERAEHIMLIDLERNDLGRLCEYGTVKVDELMVVESYQHVHHIVSNIQGKLRAGITPGQIIRAVFPGGTITGCPKVRCMEIIAELEQTGRGAYTGSVGYLNHNGDMDLNILIRTMTLQGQHLQFRTGAGIVMDSVAPNELKETRHKARGLLRAIGHDLG
ncbi:aminodeoxychorismate synthase component I [Thiothrix fructosivorans]|uniref:Aminodeoxychorismate synthase component I n=1 Tax=Thiothrix fructosivorans TaxID=111770 RepID=A0A8B0SGS4_9GAMM|nr:aminodeoxychorismate synthase component I [Thiothrix fructosivorans]MBO0613864.1 aminodeoxychorismate synthase component I [Thiothrix fructosivorans]QTX10234.1 aminodeoxychorismate synthase component I [Thiothrix fructosivorans]